MLAKSDSISTDFLYQSLLNRFAETRGAWLRRPEPMRQTTMRLISSSRFAGMNLDVFQFDDLQVIPFWRYDLIVIEQARGQEMSAVLSSIKRVRTLSSAPLVVLARRVAPEVTVAGLSAGADSVASVLSSEQVLLAHWGAMLNRWKAS